MEMIGFWLCTDELTTSNATLSLSLLLADDMFHCTRNHFAVSHRVSSSPSEDFGKCFNVFCCVIPGKVVSLLGQSNLEHYDTME